MINDRYDGNDDDDNNEDADSGESDDGDGSILPQAPIKIYSFISMAPEDIWV